MHACHLSQGLEKSRDDEASTDPTAPRVSTGKGQRPNGDLGASPLEASFAPWARARNRVDARWKGFNEALRVHDLQRSR
jgi:hypothetical protein